MNLGKYYLSKDTMLSLIHNIIDGKITNDNLLGNPTNSFSEEVIRFVKDYLNVKPANLSHTDIRVLS